MTAIRNLRRVQHLITDAHGRTVDLTPGAQAGARTGDHPGREAGRTRIAVVVAVMALPAGGLVMAALLLVVRDVIVTCMTSSSVAVMVLRALLASPGNRRR
jgi:hypothetical protein